MPEQNRPGLVTYTATRWGDLLHPRKMRKSSNPTWDYFKLVLFIVFLAELVLFLVGIIFGRILGYDLTMIACFWLGIILAACFALIVLGNVLLIVGTKLIWLIQNKTRV